MLEGEEFQGVVGTWSETLYGVVPEYRLNEAYLYARRNRNSTFPLDVSEICGAWQKIQEAERRMPPTGNYEWSRAREVCPKCNNTGTQLVVKRDPELGRDYTYGKYCGH